MPYRDFQLEYPPGALPVFVLPSLGHEGDRAAYDRWFDRRDGALRLPRAARNRARACARCGAGPLRTAAALGFFGVSPLLIGSVVLTRFDFWPAALAVFALAALLLGPARARGAPARRRDRGEALAGRARCRSSSSGSCGRAGLARPRSGPPASPPSLAAIFLPFAVLSPGGVAHSFHAQLARPLQLESLGSAILIALHHVAGTTLHVDGELRLAERHGHRARTPRQIVTTIAGAARARRRLGRCSRAAPATGARLVTHSAAAIAALLAFGKVFSPQFVIWLVPFVLARRAACAASRPARSSQRCSS